MAPAQLVVGKGVAGGAVEYVAYEKEIPGGQMGKDQFLVRRALAKGSKEDGGGGVGESG